MSTDASGSTDVERSRVRSLAEGGVIAALRLDHADLVLGRSIQQVPDVRLEPDYRSTVEPARTYLFLNASGSSFDAFERALEVDPTVTDPVLVDRYPDRRIYRVTLTDRAITYDDVVTELGGRVLESTSTRDGWTVQIRFPDRDALSAFNDFCREFSISLRVDHLRTSDDGEDGVVCLTPKQQDLLVVAYEEGYFDVPRRISQDELAERLGISKSAVSQRLRRAMSELCASTLS